LQVLNKSYIIDILGSLLEINIFQILRISLSDTLKLN